ncbi:F-box/LRR-repeat protein 7 [Parasteatoda tepidariorum]|uniref:F-box/LRR-repeat protein 7 n=1 Tax=Parasteatoda tepidariorum TaxID=114398 RepID=UPI00077F8DFC|nr:F-box/LRR-repeat protein 7 [Parasteatoda tepidariorum]XP_015908981.1 F-box/LRR-repeat protein 7 [Parasteatoda tepidariorum]
MALYPDKPLDTHPRCNGAVQDDGPLLGGLQHMTLCASGRLSPGHDLGYHTLNTTVSADETLSPERLDRSLLPPAVFEKQTTPSCWNFRGCPSPFLHREEFSVKTGLPSETTPRSADTERLVATFKGKKLPKRPSPFEKLSDNLILKIFSYLSSNELCVSARVCRRWYFLVWEPQLWTSVILSGDKIQVDRGLKTLFRLLCRDSPTLCLTVERIHLNGCSKLTDRGLATIALKCPELKVLELKGCSALTTRGVTDILSRCHSLEKLDLTGCSAVTTIQSRSSLDPSALTTCSFRLRYLDLTDCHRLDDPGLERIVRNYSQLTHLYLRRCEHITDEGLKTVANYCVLLRELSVSDCVLLTDFGLYELAKLGPNMRYLSVAKCDRISDAGVKQIARHCYKLRYLNVRGCEAVSDDALEVIARSCSKLRALDIGKCDVTDRGLKVISHHCPNLRKLSLKSCEMITDEGVKIIAYFCRGLQQLNIQDCPITLDGYRTVRKFCKRCIIEHTNPGFN